MAKVISVEDAAGVLGCSIASIYREVADGNLEALRVRGDYRIPRTAIDTYIQRGIEEQRQRVAMKHTRRRGRPATAAATATAR